MLFDRAIESAARDYTLVEGRALSKPTRQLDTDTYRKQIRAVAGAGTVALAVLTPLFVINRSHDVAADTFRSNVDSYFSGYGIEDCAETIGQQACVQAINPSTGEVTLSANGTDVQAVYGCNFTATNEGADCYQVVVTEGAGRFTDFDPTDPLALQA